MKLYREHREDAIQPSTRRSSDSGGKVIQLRIGELAQLVGVDAPTIRFYEAEGVLPVATRSSSGYRLYDDPDADRLRFIKQARGLGLGLDEIREIVAARDADSAPCVFVRRLLGRQIDQTRQQIIDLRILLDELTRLEELSRDLPTDPASDESCICHVIECSQLDAARSHVT